MKTNDILLYGGLAAAAYYLYTKSKTTTAVVPPIPVLTTTPVVATLPPATVTSQLQSGLTNLVNTVSNLINPPVTAPIQPVAVTAPAIVYSDTPPTILPTAPVIPPYVAPQLPVANYVDLTPQTNGIIDLQYKLKNALIAGY